MLRNVFRTKRSVIRNWSAKHVGIKLLKILRIKESEGIGQSNTVGESSFDILLKSFQLWKCRKILISPSAANQMSLKL